MKKLFFSKKIYILFVIMLIVGLSLSIYGAAAEPKKTQNLEFKYKGTSMMVVTPEGNAGIGTAEPEFKLTLNNDGGILAKGEADSGADLTLAGPGTRFIWYPKKAAIRAGYVEADQWDNQNIGLFSTAFGNSAMATGEASVALGALSSALNDGAVAIGLSPSATGIYALALGSGTTKAEGDYALAIGNNTNAYGAYSVSIGRSNRVSGHAAIAIGGGSDSTGNHSIAIGENLTAQSAYTLVIGRNNIISGDTTQWVASDPLFVIGNGDMNNPSNALTVLKNGYMGIGTAEPIQPLHIYGDNSKDGGETVIIQSKTDNMPGIQLYNNDQTNGGGIMLRESSMHILTGSGDLVLTGGVSGQPGRGIIFRTWKLDQLYNRMNIDTDGNVGIGLTEPKVKLAVDGIIKTTPRSSATCNADAEGGIYYDSNDKHFYGCNGANWKQLDN